MSVSKMVEFVTLSFFEILPVLGKLTLPVTVGFYAAFVSRLRFSIFPIVLIALIVLFILIDCSKVRPLRNFVIRNSGLISLNKIPLCKKQSRLIHVQFLVQCIAIL